MEKYRRVIEIYVLLRSNRKKKFSVSKIMKIFGGDISLRNAQRDLKDLLNIKGAGIKCKTLNRKKLYFYK